MSHDNGDGRLKDEGLRRALDVARATFAKARAEYGGSPLDDVAPPEPLPRLRKSIDEVTTDELIAEMIADRDAALRRAAEARAHLERLRLDESAEARRRRGERLLQ
jgi:hypothetical protein